MNERIALLGIVEILSSISCGIFILFITYRMLRVYGKRKLELDHNNTAYNIVIAGVLFSVGYVVSGVIQPILNSFRFLSNTAISKTELVFSFIAYGGLYIAIAFIFSVVICITGAKIYSNMTAINEVEEIKANNIGVAVVLVAIIFTLALMSSNGIGLLIESFIPYPDLPPRIG